MKSARGEKLKGEDAKLFSGEVWVGQQAVDLGLVDGIDTMNNFIQSTMGGPNKVNVVKITAAKKFPFLPSTEASVDFADFSEPLETTAFAHHVAKAFLRESSKSPFSNIRV